MMPPLTIIAVDDEPLNLMLIEELGKSIGIEVLSFLEPLKALEYVKTHDVDIMLTDYMMPVMDGLGLLEQAKAAKPELLSVMITAAGDNEAVKLNALGKGANDFLSKPINVAEFQLRIRNLSAIRHSQRVMSDFNAQLKREVELATGKLVQREHEALNVLSRTAEYKDPETGSHIARVAHYSKMMAAHYGLDATEQEIVFYASPLHDIGKVGISDAILLKPGKLDPEEFAVIKQHPKIGLDILQGSENPYLRAGAVIAYSHHEKYDGSGYPEGLAGGEIPLYGRITAIADVFDALTSIRPYKRAWSFEEALELIRSESGKHFDPVLVDIFVTNIETVRGIYDSFGGE